MMRTKIGGPTVQPLTMRNPTAIGVLALAVGLGATACTGSPTDATGDLATDGTFTMGVSTGLAGFDPYFDPTGSYVKLAYDSLLNLQPDGEYVSGLAEDWSADATSASFTLREGITCSDGSPLTASNVADAINFIADPANESPRLGVDVPSVPLEAVGDDAARTVAVTLESPFGFLLQTVGLAPIVCQAGMDDRSLLASASSGTGPFVLTEVVPGQTYTFERRDGYTWGPAGASTDEPGTPAVVVLRAIDNETTAANLLLSGELNLALVSGEDQQRLQDADLGQLDESLAGAWLWFNHLGGRVTEDRDVREALVSALDTESVIKVNTGGNGSAATGIVARLPRSCAEDTVSGHLPAFDAQRAAELLDSAGWVEDADGTRVKDGATLSIKLRYLPSGSSYNKPTAELVAQYWTDLGAQVEVVGDSDADFNKLFSEPVDFDVYLQGFSAFLPTQMVGFFSGPVPPAGANFAAIDNADYTEYATQAQQLAVPEACDLWTQAEHALFDNVDLAPIAFRPSAWFLSHARAETSGFDVPIPTSIRLYQ